MNIQHNLNQILDRINKAAQASGRQPEDILLLLATKTQPIQDIQEAIDLGFGLIGENRAQEVTEKFPHIQPADKIIMPYQQHFIGHLQTNKVRAIFPYVQCIQSVDRASLAEKLQAECEKQNETREIFVQVNVSFEASKQGLATDQLFPFLENLQQLPMLKIRGLMTIGLNADDEKSVREGYALLRSLNEEAIAQGLMPKTATELSMGMSHDLEWAIAEGATMIRVGSAVFGIRK